MKYIPFITLPLAALIAISLAYHYNKNEPVVPLVIKEVRGSLTAEEVRAKVNEKRLEDTTQSSIKHITRWVQEDCYTFSYLDESDNSLEVYNHFNNLGFDVDLSWTKYLPNDFKIEVKC